MGTKTGLVLAAAEGLRTFRRPVLLLWGSEEKLFPIRLAHRLAGVLPDARLIEVAHSELETIKNDFKEEYREKLALVLKDTGLTEDDLNSWDRCL